MKALEYSSDGNYYIADYCIRCGDLFYTHACQNMAWKAYNLCPFCDGKCSASDHARHNEYVESLE